MYRARIEAKCSNCEYQESIGVNIPDALHTFPREFTCRLPGWLLRPGYPHLCPRCSNEETLQKLGIDTDKIID